jgi:hypothetical protein
MFKLNQLQSVLLYVVYFQPFDLILPTDYPYSKFGSTISRHASYFTSVVHLLMVRLRNAIVHVALVIIWLV